MPTLQEYLLSCFFGLVKYSLARAKERSTITHLITLGCAMVGLNVDPGLVQTVAIAIGLLAQSIGAAIPDGAVSFTLPTLPDAARPPSIPPRNS